MLVVGPMYLAISAAGPFRNRINALPGHCHQVVVLDTLHLMVPLLKRHLSLPRSGITTKGVHSGNSMPQPSHRHSEEVANICISLWRTGGSLCRLDSLPSPPLQGLLPHGPCWFHHCPRDPCVGLGQAMWGCCPIPPSCLKLNGLQHLPQLVIIKSLDIPG